MAEKWEIVMVGLKAVRLVDLMVVRKDSWRVVQLVVQRVFELADMMGN